MTNISLTKPHLSFATSVPDTLARSHVIRLITLEKLCHGFNATPNELLGVDTSMKLSFRTPMPVTYLRRVPTLGRYTLFALCPRCNRDIEREYQAFCSNCGQMLDWSMIDDAIIID